MLSYPEYSIVEAAAIVSGIHPAAIKDYPDGTCEVKEDWESHNDAAILANAWTVNSQDLLYMPKSMERNAASKRTEEFKTVATSLERAIEAGNLAATTKQEPEQSLNIRQPHRWAATFIEKHALVYWLDENGLPRGIFSKIQARKPTAQLLAYLDPTSPYYSHSLAAAIAGHNYAASQNLNKKVKDAIKKWIRAENASGRLLDENGKEWTDTALEAIAKVANWNKEGGAPTTP